MTRLAIIEKDKCNPTPCGDFLCFKLCPVNRMGQECILKGQKAIIQEDLCNGCGICAHRCPYEAIQIINLPELLKEKPIHRFGKNSFELFRLPIIKKNTIVGIIGRNGIGKSTALAILSGNLKPNLGNYEKQPSDEEIIKHYSTSYLGEYFKNLFEGKIKVAYKPQRIEEIPKLFDGTIQELVSKADEKGISNELLKQLDLFKIKDRKLSSLSGGELQRLAIIATACKKADVYYFDEPMSFCDIMQRVKIADLINSLKKDASVMVVEHDLATLDYISDEIQIIYGAPHGYGVISQSKGVRRGINEYLDGYLPDDNVRFRNYSIHFHFTDTPRSLSKEILLSFPEFEKSFDKAFHLKVNPGVIHKGEILAVMGANGLGKSTFLKLLAGIEKPDKGELEKYNVAYKTQYLSSDVQGTVGELLYKSKEYSSGWYKSMLEKLNINKLLNEDIKNLSGGELQKVCIADTLGKDAHILAFDEPSAFIDVEDRLLVAEVIKDFVIKKEVCAIVVDHDVQFIDYIGDSMLVFEGKPSKEGHVFGPCSKREGMNRVLKMLGITYRKDKITNRPRINKPNSQLDKAQKEKGEYYYN